VYLPRQTDIEPPFLGFNLCQRYNDAFALLKLKVGPIINEIHVILAKA